MEDLLEVRSLAIDVRFGLRVRVPVEEAEQLDEIVGSLLEASPERDLVAQALSLPQDGLGGALVIPEGRIGRSRIQKGQALDFGPEVKDAPTSTESAPRGP